MMRIFCLHILFPFVLFAQTGTHILSYDVNASVNDRTREISGHVFTLLRILDERVTTYSFLVPKKMNVNSVRDANNQLIDNERSPSGQPNFTEFTLDLNRELRRNDSLLVIIAFTATFDSSSSRMLFINQKECILPYSETLSWLPDFGDPSSQQYSLEIKFPQQWTVIADEQFDTLLSEGMKIWKRSSQHPVSLSSAFTLYGLNNAVERRSSSSDSLFSVSLYSSPIRFNQQFAIAIVRQMTDAFQFFSSITKQRKPPVHITYVIAGDMEINENIDHSSTLGVHRNSAAYAVFDSSMLTRSINNTWLTNIARQFCPQSNDTTALFHDGFASYMTMRFLSSQFPHLEKRERFDAISNALSFFSTGTITQGRTSKINTEEMLTSKGRYIFSMLEYILGRETFDRIIAAMFERYSTKEISFNDFQVLCEEEYGSTLDWFFTEWLHRSTSPEFVMQWKNEKTPRGISIATITIEQRGDQFSMPVPVIFYFGSRTVTKRVFVEQAKQEFTFTFPSAPTNVELDPDYTIFRWLREIRILAHARSADLYLKISRDTVNAEREALYTLQLDPTNSTGSAPLALFVLGNLAAFKGDLERAKEHFLKAMLSFSAEETELYKLLSLVRFANVLEIEGRRFEAVPLYQRAVVEGMKKPFLFEQAITEAETFLREEFDSHPALWFGSNKARSIR